MIVKLSKETLEASFTYENAAKALKKIEIKLRYTNNKYETLKKENKEEKILLEEERDDIILHLQLYGNILSKYVLQDINRQFDKD